MTAALGVPHTVDGVTFQEAAELVDRACREGAVLSPADAWALRAWLVALMGWPREYVAAYGLVELEVVPGDGIELAAGPFVGRVYGERLVLGALWAMGERRITTAHLRAAWDAAAGQAS